MIIVIKNRNKKKKKKALENQKEKHGGNRIPVKMIIFVINFIDKYTPRLWGCRHKSYWL